MPFADYTSFEDCVRRNKDKRDPSAYCAVIKRQVEGKLSDEYDAEDVLKLREELGLTESEMFKVISLLENEGDEDEK